MNVDDMRALPLDPEVDQAIQHVAERLVATVPADTGPAVLLAALGRVAVWVFADVDGPDELVREVLGEWLTAVSNDAWATRQERS